MKIAIIGAGNMGGALARGLARGSRVATSEIYDSNPDDVYPVGFCVALKYSEQE